MNDKFHLSLEENLFLAKKLLVENIYNTAKLEGVNTTFPETQAILDGVNVPGAKLDDIQVILNLRDAWREILSITKNTSIDLAFIERINGYVSRNESLEWGVLRTGKVGIAGTNHKPPIPDGKHVSTDISAILGDTSLSASERAIHICLYIMYNQLFWDGNKRTANIVANAILIQNGAGVLSISPDNIAEFNRLLKYYYDTGNDKPLSAFLYAVAIVDFESRDATVNATVNAPVNATQRLVLTAIKDTPTATYDAIATAIGKDRATVARAIADLKRAGILHREGSDKTGSWVINDLAV